MDIQSNIIAVSSNTMPTAPTTTKSPKWLKDSSKRILNAVGNGLRTATSISHALGVEKAKVQSNLWHLKDRGLVHSVKKQGSNEFKYYLTTDKPTLDKLDLTPKKKPRKPYIKRVAKVEKVEIPEIRRETKKESELKIEVDRLIQRISTLEVILTDKEKEVWTLECEIFDKKAVIKYLEEKLFVKGVSL